MSKALFPFATILSAIMLMAASIAPNTGFVNWREANMFRWALCVTRWHWPCGAALRVRQPGSMRVLLGSASLRVSGWVYPDQKDSPPNMLDWRTLGRLKTVRLGR